MIPCTCNFPRRKHEERCLRKAETFFFKASCVILENKQCNLGEELQTRQPQRFISADVSFTSGLPRESRPGEQWPHVVTTWQPRREEVVGTPRVCMNGWPQHRDPAPSTVRRLKIPFNSQREIIPFDPGGGTIALLGKLAGLAVAHSVPIVWKMSTGRSPGRPNCQSLGHWLQSNYHYLHSRGVCPTGFICTEVSLKIFMNVTYIS